LLDSLEVPQSEVLLAADLRGVVENLLLFEGVELPVIQVKSSGGQAYLLFLL